MPTFNHRDGSRKGKNRGKDSSPKKNSSWNRESSYSRSSSEDSSERNDADNNRSSYKKTRSFSRNKELRKEGFSREKGSFEKKGDRSHHRPFKRDYEKPKSTRFSDEKPRFRSNKGPEGEFKRKDKSPGEKPRFHHEKGEGKEFKRKEKSFGDKPRFHHDKGEGKEFKRKEKSFSHKPRFRHDKEESKGSDKRDKDNRYSNKGKKHMEERGGDWDRFEKKESKFATEQKRLKYEELEEAKGFKGSYRKEKFSAPKKTSSAKKDDGLTRLNKYLAHAGIASRRDADNLIKSGTVKVNGQVVTEMGFKVKPGDTVTYGDAAVKNEKKVYILLNKPKDYISTVDDPQERKTVMELIAGACKERVYPVGRLDRNTTGLLLLTNDGELTKKLTHPKHGIKKIYHVSLNKGLKPDDFRKIVEGIELEDGPIQADDLAFVGEGKKEVGIEIHSGRNRIVRRIFEYLGYDVDKLDRVAFAGLTKKDLPRGKYRFLNQKEISFLHMIG